MCGRGRKGTCPSLPSECSCHAFLPNWLFGCKLLFSSIFLWWGGADASRSSFMPTRTRLAFSFTQQEPSGGSFDGKNSHWRSWWRGGGSLISLHLCIGNIMVHSRLLMRNEWGGGEAHVWRAQSKSQCAACTLCCMYALVSAWWYFIARSVKGDAMDRMTGLLICIISCWH